MKSLVLTLVGVALFLGGAGCSSQNTTQPPLDQPKDNTAVTCNSNEPKILSLSTDTGKVGASIEIKGCNFAGFEGDLNAILENSLGQIGFLYGEAGSTNSLLKVVLKSPLCQEDNSYKGGPCTKPLTLVPGVYKIYVNPWAKKSNVLNFTIQQ